MQGSYAGLSAGGGGHGRAVTEMLRGGAGGLHRPASSSLCAMQGSARKRTPGVGGQRERRRHPVSPPTPRPSPCHSCSPWSMCRVLRPAGWSRSISASWRACLAGPFRHTSAQTGFDNARRVGDSRDSAQRLHRWSGGCQKQTEPNSPRLPPHSTLPAVVMWSLHSPLSLPNLHRSCREPGTGPWL